MSLSSANMMKLMAYADGELEGDERKEAEMLLATDPDSVRFVEQLGGLGDLLELGYEERSGKTVTPFDVADAVMARASVAADESKPANVTSLAAARERREKSAKRGSGAKVGIAMVAVLALAASVFLVASHRSDETPMAKGPSVPAAQPTAASTVASSNGAGVDVSTVNSPGNSVSVFYLPTANELSTSVVVWVDETGEK